MGYEWTEEEKAFEVEAVVGKVVADGQTAYANQGCFAAGIVLYRGRATHQTWCGMSQRLAADETADEASAREDAKLIDLEEAEGMPAA
eukprot:5789592-Pleurochrysis_carterae.AAC.1